MSTRRRKTTLEKAAEEGAFLLRCLDEAADCELSVRPQERFRPTLTLYNSVTSRMKEVLHQLSIYQSVLQQRDVDELGLNAIVALMDFSMKINDKAPLINMVLEWLSKNPQSPAMRNSIIMSIAISDLSFPRIIVIRHAIHTYFTQADLHQRFEIFLNNQGYVFLMRKRALLEPYLSEESDQKVFADFQREIQEKYRHSHYFRMKSVQLRTTDPYESWPPKEDWRGRPLSHPLFEMKWSAEKNRIHWKSKSFCSSGRSPRTARSVDVRHNPCKNQSPRRNQQELPPNDRRCYKCKFKIRHLPSECAASSRAPQYRISRGDVVAIENDDEPKIDELTLQ